MKKHVSESKETETQRALRSLSLSFIVDSSYEEDDGATTALEGNLQ